ncbi:MAG: protein translocase subunit SecD [Ignavibacteriae bacterium HGW-Ignavibacteriae-2]|jgi:preprotein translocase subunit SecD|nr:protein translocase subunit SecD [Bacteroidota bacterium]PKL89806.1 MAG: protein translocase subunit SecD [Ignavibacteriae bacterium HGW-Ignavibacteriae-2]
MKEFRFRIFIIVAFVALSVYLLYPTYADYTNNKEIQSTVSLIEKNIKVSQPTISKNKLESILEFKEDSIRVADPSIRENREKRVKLGLDLQGGMYLVMEVNTAKLLENLVKNPDDEFKAILSEAEADARITDENIVSILAQKIQAKGKRLSRYFGTIRDEDADIITKLQEQEADAVSRAIEIINNRVNQYGVSEPSIQKQGARRIIVELPGIAKEEEAKRLLQGSALLEFKFAREADFAIPIMNRIDEVLAGKIDTSNVKDTTSTKDMSQEDFAKLHPFYSIAVINPQSPYPDAFVKESNRDRIMSYLNRPEVQNVIPDNVEFLFSAKPITQQEGENIFQLYMVNKTPELTGGVITDAQANIDPQSTSAVVYMNMDSEGAREWARITGSNIGKRCAIVLDGGVYSAPRINSKIPSGRSVIEGMEDLNEAKLLEIVLKAGALPAPVEIIEERTVGPSLGQDSIYQGFTSTLLGFFVVAIFMMVYYKRAGTVADLALFFTMLFIMGILAGFQATLTLPGIAGIILTIGMAVDANVIIYERIREELAVGKTTKAGIESGFAHSFSAIFDSNITTFFTGIILYQFGSGPVQGFALTLMIGIACSLFSALVVTRLILDWMAAKGLRINL